jgi:hypothetical protein
VSLARTCFTVAPAKLARAGGLWKASQRSAGTGGAATRRRNSSAARSAKSTAPPPPLDPPHSFCSSVSRPEKGMASTGPPACRLTSTPRADAVSVWSCTSRSQLVALHQWAKPGWSCGCTRPPPQPFSALPHIHTRTHAYLKEKHGEVRRVVLTHASERRSHGVRTDGRARRKQHRRRRATHLERCTCRPFKPRHV